MASETCTCLANDAEAAWEHLHESIVVIRIIMESHFVVNLLQCNDCQHWFLYVCTEMIDWNNGDDDQQFYLFPIPDALAGGIIAQGRKFDGRALDQLFLNGRHLSMNRKSPTDRGITWHTGPLLILPHD